MLAIDQSYEQAMNSLAIPAAESIKSISADLAKMLTQTVHRKPRTQEMDYCTNSWKRHLGTSSTKPSLLITCRSRVPAEGR